MDKPLVITATALGIDPGFHYTGVAAISRLSDGRLLSRGVQLIETEKGSVRVGALADSARRMRDLFDAFVRTFPTVTPNAVGIEDYDTRVPEAWDRLRETAIRIVQLRVPATHAEFVAMIQDPKIAKAWISAISDMSGCIADSRGFDGFGLGNAAKTIGVEWIAASVAWQYKLPVYLFTPSQLHKTITGPLKLKRKSTKEDIGQVLDDNVIDLREHALTIRARTARENPNSQAADARVSHVHDAMGHAYMALLKYEEEARAA